MKAIYTVLLFGLFPILVNAFNSLPIKISNNKENLSNIIQVTTINDSGVGSLRSAIAQAQSGDVISFSPALSNQTIILTSGYIRINKDLTIDGTSAPGLKISGNKKDHIFFIQDRFKASINNITFQDGYLPTGKGGAIESGAFTSLTITACNFNNNVGGQGGAVNAGYQTTLLVTDSKFTNNDGTTNNSGFSAGAVSHENNGFLTIKRCTFTNNKGIVGGAVYNLLSGLIVENSIFTDNVGVHGGAIFTDGASDSGPDAKPGEIGGTNRISFCSFKNNKATGRGGALDLFIYQLDNTIIENCQIEGSTLMIKDGLAEGGGVRANGNVLIQNVSFINNFTEKQGGGLWLDGYLNGANATATVQNCTFSGNKAGYTNTKETFGGAILINPSATLALNVLHTTIVNNYAGDSGGAFWVVNHSQPVRLTNTIVANNNANTGSYGQQVVYPFEDGGGNLEFPSFPVKVVANATVVDPQLASIQSINSLSVFPLTASSPCIDKGVSTPVQTDAVGTLRDNKPDIGAVEFSKAPCDQLKLSGTTSVSLSCAQPSSSLSVSVSGGVAPYSYRWDDNSTNALRPVSSSGTYSVTVTSGNGCSRFASISVVSSTSAPIVSLNSLTLTCALSNGQLIPDSRALAPLVSGGVAPYSYRWSNGSTASSLSVVAAGVYSVTVTGANGCSGIASSTVSIGSPPPSGALALIQLTCTQPVGTLSGAAVSGITAGTYRWSTGSTAPSVNVSTAGVYSVTATSTNGCYRFGSISVVSSTSAPIVSLNSLTLTCALSNGQLIPDSRALAPLVSGGVAPYSYRWSNGSTASSLSVVAAGVYSVTVTGANGCSGIASSTVSIGSPPPSGALALIQLTCTQPVGTLSGAAVSGITAGTYRWSTGSTAPSVNVSTAGVYSVTATSTNGCYRFGSISVVSSTSAPIVSLNSLTLTCALSNGQLIPDSRALAPLVSGGVAPYSYRWSNGSTASSLSVVAAGVYSVTVTGANGCSGIASALVSLSCQSGSLPFTSSSFLGGSGNDDIRGMAIQKNGTVILAANIGSFSPNGVNPILLNGATSQSGGVIIRLTGDGKKIISLTRIAAKLVDLAIDDADNVYVAAGQDGFIKLNPNITQILYTTVLDRFVHRIDASKSGFVAILVSSETDPDISPQANVNINVYNPEGKLLFKQNNISQNSSDIAIDDNSQTVIGIGYKNFKTSPQVGTASLPVYVPVIKGWSYSGVLKYVGYDWSNNTESPSWLNKAENNMADVKPIRCIIGKDGKLYITFEVAGGNHILRYAPFNNTQKINIVGGDKYFDFYNTRDEIKTFVGRYDAGTGNILLGQQFVSRLPGGGGNTVFARKGDIAVDNEGRVYLTGTSAYGLPLTIDQFPGEYTGGAYILILSPDFKQREFCIRITVDGTGRAVAVLNKNNWGFAGSTSSKIYSINPSQNNIGGAIDGFYSIKGQANTTARTSTPEIDNVLISPILYPNPTRETEIISIQFSSKITGIFHVKWYNQEGQLKLEESGSIQEKEIIALDNKPSQSGFYFLKLAFDNQQYTYKIFIID